MSEELLQSLESVCEAIVFAELSDLQSLVGLHTRFEDIEKAASAAECPAVAEAAKATAKLLEAIVLEEVDDPKAAFGAVGEVVGTMQQIVRDGRPVSEVTFPARLGLSRREPAEGTVECAATPPPQEPAETVL